MVSEKKKRVNLTGWTVSLVLKKPAIPQSIWQSNLKKKCKLEDVTLDFDLTLFMFKIMAKRWSFEMLWKSLHIVRMLTSLYVLTFLLVGTGSFAKLGCHNQVIKIAAGDWEKNKHFYCTAGIVMNQSCLLINVQCHFKYNCLSHVCTCCRWPSPSFFTQLYFCFQHAALSLSPP